VLPEAHHPLGQVQAPFIRFVLPNARSPVWQMQAPSLMLCYPKLTVLGPGYGMVGLRYPKLTDLDLGDE
jgi:hypothetical protein